MQTERAPGCASEVVSWSRRCWSVAEQTSESSGYALDLTWDGKIKSAQRSKHADQRKNQVVVELIFCLQVSIRYFTFFYQRKVLFKSYDKLVMPSVTSAVGSWPLHVNSYFNPITTFNVSLGTLSRFEGRLLYNGVFCAGRSPTEPDCRVSSRHREKRKCTESTLENRPALLLPLQETT